MPNKPKSVTKLTHGGARTGAGRPSSLGGPTTVMRVPSHLKPQISQYIQATVKQLPLPPEVFCPDPDAPVRDFLLFADKVAAGFPSPATDYQERRLDLNQMLVAHPETTFFLRAKGLSMLGAGIHDGDVMVVDRLIEPAHGHVVIAVVDGEFTVKRLYRQGQVIKLMAENPDFPDITFKEWQELLVWGVVTYVVHAL